MPCDATPRTGSGDQPCCILCGRPLASDNGGRLCGPCERDRRDYDPARDPSFDVALEELFLLHPNEAVHPLADLGISPQFKWSVRSSIRRLRRRGMHITGAPHSGGYVYEPQTGTP